MTHQTAPTQVDSRRRLASLVKIVLCTTVLLATVFVIRQFAATSAAVAQNPASQPPRVKTSPTPRSPARPAPGTAAGGSRPGPGNARKAGAGGSATSSPAASSASTTTSNVVAVVNAEPITRNELAGLCLKRYGTEVLESLVNRHLILQRCESRHIEISNREIDEEILRIAQKFSLSAEDWLKMLQSERNVSVEQYRRDIIWPTLALRKLAAEKLEVSAVELDREFESEYGPKVQVRMISLTTEQKAKDVWVKAKASPDQFPKLAKSESEDPNSASAAGLIPPIGHHIGEPEVEKTVFAMQPGQISPILHVANQYLIFRCEKHLPAAPISPQYRKTIDERLQERIVERKLRDAAGELFSELQSTAQVVNVWNDAQKQAQMPGVAVTINGNPISIETLSEECVARYGREVLDMTIDNKLLAQALKRRNSNVSKAEINEEIARAAESFGFYKDGQPDVARWLGEIVEKEGLSVEDYVNEAVWPSVALKKLVGNTVQVTDEDLQKGFEANYGERVEVLAIVSGNQRTAQEVWDMARKNPSREFFGQLAEQYSIEPVSRANFGEIPPIRRHSGQPQIEKAAFALNPAEEELSGIVVMGDKYIILKCIGRTEPVVDSLDVVREELEKDLREKKLRLAMSDHFEQLKAAAQIDNFLAGTSQLGKAAPAAAAGVDASSRQPVEVGSRPSAGPAPR